MHLQVSIALLFILLTGGFSLYCYKCTDQQPGYCSSETTCSNASCRSTKTIEYFGPYREKADNLQRERDRIPRPVNKHAACTGNGMSEVTVSYGCAMPHECKSWSLGTGCWTIEHISKCCYTNLCNRQTSGSFSHILNGKTCFTCDEVDCSKTISCWENEDYCFTAFKPSSHQSVATKGCASKSACDLEPGKILGLDGNIKCCAGNLCNGAQSVSQSFLFLCCSLLSYFLLH